MKSSPRLLQLEKTRAQQLRPNTTKKILTIATINFILKKYFSTKNYNKGFFKKKIPYFTHNNKQQTRSMEHK